MSEEHYPANTATALSTMREDRGRVMDKRRRLSDEASAKRSVLSVAEVELERVMGRGPGGTERTAGATKVAEAEAKVAAAKLEADRYREIVRAYDQETEQATWALQRCGSYLERPDVAGKPLRPHPGAVVPKRRAGETPLATVTRVRGDIENLKSELAAIAARPLPAKDAKAAARRQIETLAMSNVPDVTPLFAGQTMKLPATDVKQSPNGPRVAYGVPDAMSLLLWTYGDAILAKIEKAIDAAADDRNALTAEQKIAETKRLKVEILAAERVEEALIESAYAEGQFITRRPDADPRAILWLAADMPEITR